MEEQIYYRPVWTCGRFNAKESVAIYYNLIDGMAYFFEGMSASIIGLILALPRNAAYLSANFQTYQISQRTVLFLLWNRLQR